MNVAEHIRARLVPPIEAFASAVRASVPNSRVQANVSASTSFPIFATVGVSALDPAGDEVVVLSVDVWTDGTEVRLSCDLTEGGGLILLQGPTVTTSAPLTDSPELDGWLVATDAFVRGAVTKAVTTARSRGL